MNDTLSLPQKLLNFLTSSGISYTKYDHPAVFTCEEAQKLELKLPGADTKNLFLAERGAQRRFLVVVGHSKRVALKELASLLGVKRLDFGKPDELLRLLGVTPGSVTLMGLMMDTKRELEVIIDGEIWSADLIQCHPMENTSSITLRLDDLRRFLESTGHDPKIMDVPAVV